MQHVIAKAIFFLSHGYVGMRIMNTDVRTGVRPKDIGEIIGADQTILEILNSRVMPLGGCVLDMYETAFRAGAGCTLIIENLDALKWTKASWLEKLRAMYGALGSSGIICLIRDLGAPETCLCGDVAAGVAETDDIVSAALKEIVEIGLYNETGWVRFLVPSEYAQYQGVVDAAQEAEWLRLEPDFPRGYEAQLELVPMQADAMNGKSCIISSEPSKGSIEFIFLFKVKLGITGVLIRDTEHMPNFALNRTPLVIVQRSNGQSPLAFMFGPNGLNINVPPIFLSGEAMRHAINGKVRSVLHAMGWIKKEKDAELVNEEV